MKSHMGSGGIDSRIVNLGLGDGDRSASRHDRFIRQEEEDAVEKKKNLLAMPGIEP
jgi:hypothetical protein